jgi:hypothetical protein
VNGRQQHTEEDGLYFHFGRILNRHLLKALIQMPTQKFF